jgi:hypothetical protein
VGHAGGQKPNARELLVTDHLAGAELHLPVEVVTGLLESLRHVVEGGGQFGHLVAGVEPDAEAEIPLRHPA